MAKSTRVDEGSGDLVGFESRPQWTGDPNESVGVQLSGQVAHRPILAQQPHGRGWHRGDRSCGQLETICFTRCITILFRDEVSENDISDWPA